MRGWGFWAASAALLAAGLAFTELADNPYYFNATYVVLQALIMAVAWNILGGFTGYVNFGSAAFFAVGAYTTIFLQKAFGLPLPLMILAAALVCGLIGLAVGYLTLRLKGVYFAIATLAMGIVLETLVNNWSYVGGAKGTFMLTPDAHLWFDSYSEMLFMIMLVLALGSIAISRALSRKRISPMSDAPSSGCRRISLASASDRLSVLSRTLSRIPILPTSWSRAPMPLLTKAFSPLIPIRHASRGVYSRKRRE